MAAAINLLPDIRLAKLRARRNRHLAVGVATIVCVISASVVLLLLLLIGAQNIRLAQINNNIKNKQAELDQITNLADIVTLQQHLDSLPGLYNSRIHLSRFFKVLVAVSPKELTVSKLELDSLNTLKVSGQSRNFATVNKLVKALEASTQDGRPNFDNIVLESLTNESVNKAAFTLTATMAPEVTYGNR